LTRPALLALAAAALLACSAPAPPSPPPHSGEPLPLLATDDTLGVPTAQSAHSTPEPALAAHDPPAAEPQTVRQPVTSVHTVLEGQSLRSIAAEFGVSTETLIAANGLRDPDALRVGQELLVPTVDGVLHTVSSGDSLTLIAERYGVELSELIAANGLGESADTLSVGVVLIVPGARAMVRAPEPEPAVAREPQAQQEVARAAPQPVVQPSTYTVREGDTLRSIAQQFGLDILSLVAINGLSNPDLITPGRTLRVSATETLEHVVAPGETVADIAWHYQVASTVLLDANGVANPNHIVVGTALIVPGGQPRSPASGSAPTPIPQPPQPTPTAQRPQPKPAVKSAPAPAERPAAAPTERPAQNANGERVITAKVTGYAIGAGAVSSRTASGTQTHWGTVAADTRLYPFGTRVRIQGFDDMIFVVEDTGSAVRGNVFDIWFPDAASARRLGATTRQVTILP